MKNVVSFDVEDYFHVGAFAENIDKSQWNTLPSRVEANTEKILEMLAKNGTLGTFFVLGWVAEHFPRLVQRIANAGHEIACHSQEHRRVFDLSPSEFRSDTLRAKESIENACGLQVRGYRAPSFSITHHSLWALEILADLGFAYDSSIFPVRHPNYGMPAVPRFPFVINTQAGPLVEFPLTTVQLGGSRSPLSGGAYLRMLPYWYTRWGFGYVNGKENQPFCLYLHPWELDSEQPRMKGRLTSRLRHYIGLRSTEIKLTRLLKDFEFQRMGTMIDAFRSGLTAVSMENLAQSRS
ncbi:MAG: XrtA system polysaccharide deacetylase [Candidatus Acidiferrum sp.]|jgi:polysaccharide deacetylase family protein (PEP-CTERM system associated)